MCSALKVKKLRVHRKKTCYFCRWEVFQAFTGAVISGLLRCAEPELGVDDSHVPPCEHTIKTSLNDQRNGLKTITPSHPYYLQVSAQMHYTSELLRQRRSLPVHLMSGSAV